MNKNTNIAQKIAVIVTGYHYAGKSKTINDHLKPKLNIGRYVHNFTFNAKAGWILSQSLEEAGRKVADVIKKYGKYEYLVLAARPSHQTPSSLNALKTCLTAAGYTVHEVDLAAGMGSQYYAGKADDIISKF